MADVSAEIMQKNNLTGDDVDWLVPHQANLRIIDATGESNTNNITVARNGHKIQGSASNLTISTNRAAIGLVYFNVAQGWLLSEKAM